MDYKLLNGYNLDINEQINILVKIIIKSKNLSTAIERAESLNLDNYYIGAGCIAQTVWNYLSYKPLDYGIKDIDFVYFDDKNLGEKSENIIVARVKALYSDLDIEIDVKNEARVHLWYKDHFGYDIKPYASLEDAINSWPTTSTAVGIRKDKNGELKVYAPFGLNDLFCKIVRANKAQVTKEIYEAKTARWIGKWPDLKVIPWEK